MCLKARRGDIHFLLFVLMIFQGLSVGIVQLIANCIGLLILQRICDLFRVTWIRFLTGVRIIK